MTHKSGKNIRSNQSTEAVSHVSCPHDSNLSLSVCLNYIRMENKLDQQQCYLAVIWIAQLCHILQLFA